VTQSTFVRGDALSTLSALEEGSAELVYLDPPFAVEKSFTARPTAPKGPGNVRARANGPVAYSDSWASLDAYLEWLTPRLALAFRAVSTTGTMWVHLDHHAVRDVEIALRGMLGRGALAGEIVWVPGNGSKAKRGIPRAHQSLLVYKKGAEYTWNSRAKEAREPYASTSLSMHFAQKDDDGRAYRDRTVGRKTYRYYADEGRAVGSVWTDCPAMLANTPLRGEGTGYPTQKPERLLARIVALATRPGDLVVDPFAGSGTTLAVAHAMGRRFFGGDIGELSVAIVTARLARAGATFATSLDAKRS
jgi:site-specific DNA-methyltransferase (adenine-specific)